MPSSMGVIELARHEHEKPAGTKSTARSEVSAAATAAVEKTIERRQARQCVWIPSDLKSEDFAVTFSFPIRDGKGTVHVSYFTGPS